MLAAHRSNRAYIAEVSEVGIYMELYTCDNKLIQYCIVNSGLPCSKLSDATILCSCTFFLRINIGQSSVLNFITNNRI